MTIEIRTVMPGAQVIMAHGHVLAAGFPEEVVKAWMRAGVKPTAWLVPDVRSRHGIVQWALEFPLYYALFVQGVFARGERIPVVVERAAWPAVVEYLRLTLLGLSRDELQAAEVSPRMCDVLSAEQTHLALKRKDGSVASIEDFLEPVFFDAEGVAILAGEHALGIKRHGDNVYSFSTRDDRIDEHTLEVPLGQQPPYAQRLAQAPVPVGLQPFELVMLGASNGFDPDNPCSNMVVQSNGRFLLIDAGPYIRATLAHVGIGLHQLGGLVLTHAHEDHAVGLSALLELRQRLRLFISRENAEIMRRKLAILNPDVANPARLLDDAFDLVLIDTSRSYDFFGLGLRFHYTFHSIPCTGLEVSATRLGVTRRLLLVGDSDSRAHIEAAHDKGVTDARRHAELMALYEWRGDLIVADAGEGQIHGAPADFANSDSPVVYMHTGKLKAEDELSYTLARAGYRYTLESEQLRLSPVERALGFKALRQTFAGADADALEVLLDAACAESCNTGQLLMREGDTSRDVFIVLSGELGVYRGAPPRRIATLASLEVAGERAAVNAAPRTATVRAETPARLLRIAGDSFAAFVERALPRHTLRELWEKSCELDGVRLLDSVSVSLKRRLAEVAVRRSIEPGATLIREQSKSNTVFVLARGRVQVYKGQAPLIVGGEPVIVEPGTLLGETAPFLNKERNASIVTLDECEVLAIPGKDFKRLVEECPQLFCHISRTVRARAAA